MKPYVAAENDVSPDVNSQLQRDVDAARYQFDGEPANKRVVAQVSAIGQKSALAEDVRPEGKRARGRPRKIVYIVRRSAAEKRKPGRLPGSPKKHAEFSPRIVNSAEISPRRTHLKRE